MQYLFLKYQSNDYFLTHVYEQLFAMELMRYGYHWEKGNLGSKYIEVNWKNDVPLSEITRLIEIPDLNPAAVANAYNIVKEETLQNLVQRPVLEMLNFRTNSFEDIRLKIAKPISIEEMLSFIANEQLDRSYEVLNDNKIIYNKNWPSIKDKQKNDGFTPAFELYICESSNYFLTYKTNAKDALDGVAYELLGEKITSLWNLNNLPITYQTIIDPLHKLWLSFSCQKESVDELISNIANIANSLTFSGRDLDFSEINSVLGKVYQYTDWNKELSLKKIKTITDKTRCGYKLIGPEIVLDWNL